MLPGEIHHFSWLLPKTVSVNDFLVSGLLMTVVAMRSKTSYRHPKQTGWQQLKATHTRLCICILRKTVLIFVSIFLGGKLGLIRQFGLEVILSLGLKRGKINNIDPD